MVFYQMDLTRFLQVYIVQGIVAVIFLVLAYKILSRDRKRLNLILSLAYIFTVTGIFINFIYAPLTIESVVIILYYLTLIFMFMFGAFLLVFVLMLIKSEKVITTSKQIIIILLYGLALACMVFVPEGTLIPGRTTIPVEISANTDWKPVWSDIFFIYFVSVLLLELIPLLYYALKIYQQFEDELIKKKWKFFVYGIILLYVFSIGTLFSNTLNIQTFRTVWSLIGLVLVIVSPYLIYYGVGKQIEK